MGEDLKETIEGLKEIISEYLEYLDPLKRIVPLLSLIALFFGVLEFSIYSIFVVKDPSFIVEDFSHLSKTFLFYVFILSLFFIISIIFLLVAPLYFQIHFQTIKEEMTQKEKEQPRRKNILLKILKNLWNSLKSFIIYIIYIAAIIILFIFYMEQGGFSIFPIIGFNMPTWFSILLFIPLISILLFMMGDLSQRIAKAKGKDKIKAIFSFIIYTFSTIAIIYTSSLIIMPFHLLKLGYFKANLVLEKEYVNKPEFQDYLKMCHQNTQNNEYCIPFFIFLKMDSEYIVGCSKDSNVRIYIPADKVIAIEYIEEENKNTPAPQQQTPQQQNKQTKN
jgi:hypothetical protein